LFDNIIVFGHFFNIIYILFSELLILDNLPFDISITPGPKFSLILHPLVYYEIIFIMIDITILL